MAHTLTLENQDGDTYYRDFFNVEKYTFADSKIKTEGVYHRDHPNMVFYIHAISFENETQGEHFAQLLNSLKREKPENVLYALLFAMITAQ